MSQRGVWTYSGRADLFGVIARLVAEGMAVSSFHPT
jgi:hypothetical protein